MQQWRHLGLEQSGAHSFLLSPVHLVPQRPRRSLGSHCPICMSAVQDFTSAGHCFLLGILPSPQIQPIQTRSLRLLSCTASSTWIPRLFLSSTTLRCRKAQNLPAKLDQCREFPKLTWVLASGSWLTLPLIPFYFPWIKSHPSARIQLNTASPKPLLTTAAWGLLLWAHQLCVWTHMLSYHMSFLPSATSWKAPKTQEP